MSPPPPSQSPPGPKPNDAKASRTSTDTAPRRSSLSALSLNRFSFHRAEVPPPKPVQKPAGRSHEKKAATTGSRAVQRRTSGVERRVSGTRNHGSASSRTPPRTPTVVDEPPAAPAPPPASTLKKKRSLFKRVADTLTRSRTSLRDDYKARRSSVHLEPSVPRRATLPNETLAPEKKNIPPPSARKSRQPPLSINIYASENSRTVPPSSPRPEAILAAMSRQTASLRQQPPSPIRQPLSFASLSREPSSMRQPQSPVRQTLSPVPSSRGPPSPVWQPSSSSREPPSPVSPPVTSTRRSPNLVTRHPSNPRQPSPAPSSAPPHLPALSPVPIPVPSHPKRTDPRDARDADRDRDQEHLPSTREDEEEESDEEEERRQSEAKVNQWLTVPESPTTSSSLDHSHSQSSHSHYSAGGRVVSGRRFEGGFGGIDEEGANGFGGEEMNMWRGAVTSNEVGDEDLMPEVERMALEAEERVRARGEGPPNPQNVVGMGGRKEGNLRKARRQFGLFGKRRGKGGEDTTLDTHLRARASIRAPATEHDSASRRSLSFLSSSPGSPTSPVTPTMYLAPPTVGVPTATPRPRKSTANPTMHTRGSILLETKEIEDPEVRRLSEMVFLS